MRTAPSAACTGDHGARHQRAPAPYGERRPEDTALRLLPVGLRVEGRPVLVVGAGPVAARKAAALVAQGAVVTVVAPRHSADMDAVGVAVRRTEEFRPSHLDGAWFVVAATGVTDVDGTVHEHAEARRVWCNAADDPAHCSAVLPAVVRRGDITVAIATGGRSPAVASWLRRRIDAVLDDHAQDVLEVAARVRSRMRSAGRRTEVSGWAEVLDGEAVVLARSGRLDELERRLTEAVLPGLTEAVLPGLTEAVLPGLTEAVLPGLTEAVLPGLTEAVLPDDPVEGATP